jgi:aquaporin Z
MGISKLLTEFIGTFFLVLTVTLAVASGSPAAGLAIGAMLMVMVYMGGHISGAHYNPAVTLGVFLRGRCSAADVGPYMIVQLLAGFLAAAAGAHMCGKVLIVAPGSGVSTMHAVLNEVLFTFALVLVVLNVATLKKVANNSYYGLAIGFTVAAAAIAGGGVSGGAYNPAVGVGSLLFAALKGNSIGHAWIYVVGPFGGAILAAAVFKVQNGNNAE